MGRRERFWESGFKVELVGLTISKSNVIANDLITCDQTLSPNDLGRTRGSRQYQRGGEFNLFCYARYKVESKRDILVYGGPSGLPI